MDIKEITALRKSGQLDEALRAAETEFSNRPNIYTVGALFWCLNDLHKLQSGDEALLTCQRMEELYEEYCPGDDYMRNALRYARFRMTPGRDLVKDAVDKAKTGDKPYDRYLEVLELFQSGKLDQSLFQDFGWLIYYTLKHTPANDADTRKQLLHQYFKIQLPRPSLLHSLILSEGIKIEENTPLQFRIRDFISLWGLENLTEDDWQQYKADNGHVASSNVEKLIKVFAKEVKTDGIVAPKELCELIDTAIRRFPNHQHLPYYKAIVLISQGEEEEAIKYYKHLILQNPAKQYLWSQLSHLAKDLDTKIGLLSKALSLGDDDAYLGKVHLRMAELLLQKGLSENAAYEVKVYKDTYSSKHWGLKQDFWEVANKLTGVASAESNDDVYKQYAVIADDFIYTELPSVMTVKVADRFLEDRNRPGKKFLQWTLRTKGETLHLKNPRKFGLQNSANGSVFEVKLHTGKIVWIKPVQPHSLPSEWLKDVTGEVTLRTDRNGRPYAIIDHVYVGAALLTNVLSGQSVRIRAVSQDDGRWSAVALWKR